ncbi:DNA-binding transcriptional MerR regulator [Kribbella sp. VKM Ac-2571]|uniref:MerR family transcriptional regulator n=1 Tax=Kribbella sp. VKM Ac-2571 TaxID=2512222 RepID=UPI00105D68EC|nr:MerR family transcriptional regulator [Kribbella sp. VKM Ac-2571]TDO48932.1 DNA-binding transcriptional MerR regulator [Kribbella sp. VKM Ac-2571]
MADLSGARTPLPADAVWPVGHVAAELGVPTVTLRAWERRYGVGPRLRTDGKHRRYSTEDVDRLRRMIALMDAGMSAVDAARLSHAQGPVAGVDDLLGRLESYRVVEVDEALERLFEDRGTGQAWKEVIAPVFRELERRAERRPDCADLEVTLAAAVDRAAQQHVARRRLEPSAGAVLLVPRPGETHTVPLTILRAALIERGQPAIMLAAGGNDLSLLAAAQRLRPVIVVLWSMTRHAGQAALRRRFENSGYTTVTAGPGWPRPARDLDGLDQAVTFLLAEAGPAAAR